MKGNSKADLSLPFLCCCLLAMLRWAWPAVCQQRPGASNWLFAISVVCENASWTELWHSPATQRYWTQSAMTDDITRHQAVYLRYVLQALCITCVSPCHLCVVAANTSLNGAKTANWWGKQRVLALSLPHH